MWTAALFWACAAPPSPIEETCEPGPLLAGEIRAKRIACGDEIAPSGEARVGDWLLENSRIRFGIRDATQPLTQLVGTGGTIVDVAQPQGADFIIEAIPYKDDQWFTDAKITSWSDEERAAIVITGTLPDGRNHSVSYILEADSAGLEIIGADVLELVPMSRSGRVGTTMEMPVDDEYLVMAGNGPIIDYGGWVRWTNIERWWVGERNQVYAGLWPDGRLIEGTTDGSWIVIKSEESTVARVPVDDDRFSVWIPHAADAVMAYRSGYDWGEPRAPEDGLHLPLEGGGFVDLSVTDEDGATIPATLLWNDEDWTHLPGDAPIPVGPGLGSGFVDGGPQYERVEIPEMDIDGEVPLTMVLPRATTPGLLAKTDVLASPDRTQRRSSSSLLRKIAATGVGFMVAIADDEVATVSSDSDSESWIQVLNGSRAGADYGQPVAWPWSSTTSKPAHGAAPWMRLDSLDLLGVMTKNGSRWSAIDTQWVETAGDIAGWQMKPNAFQLAGINDRAVYQDLLDAWLPITALGPTTWIEGVPQVDFTTTDAMRGILLGQTTATTGPRILLTIDGQGLGEFLEAPGMLHREVHITVQAAPRYSLTHAALFGPGGKELIRWPLNDEQSTRLSHTIWLSSLDYVIAAAWNEDDPEDGDWAVTSPIWGGRP